jgi:hypothetical protein
MIDITTTFLVPDSNSYRHHTQYLIQFRVATVLLSYVTQAITLTAYFLKIYREAKLQGPTYGASLALTSEVL